MFFGKKVSFLLEAIILSTIVGVIIPLVFFLRSITIHQPFTWEGLLTGFVFSFTVTFCIYFFNVRIIHKFQENEKKFKSQFNRIVLELIITNLIASLVMTAVFGVFLKIYNYDWDHNGYALYDNIIIAIIVTVVAVFIIEALFFFKKWKNSIIESEKLRRRNVEIQYAALTSQINPHFLFNSLNALSSLIQADPDKAVVFTREFSKIYRYVLDSNDKLIVSLEEELNFLYSFLYLQKIRFDKALEYKIEVNAACLEMLLPPLSLQLLVENAIKHNEISQDNPLIITVKGEGRQVTVTNNYRPIKKITRKENGLGLKNLTDRYSHYTEIKPDFRIEDNLYVAVIPLLKEE